MRTVLIGAAVFLTAGTFFGAERLISSNAEVAALEQKTAFQTAVDAQLAQANKSFALEIAALKKAGASSAAQISTLSASVETLTAKRNELSLQLIAAQDQTTDAAKRLATAEAKNNELLASAAEKAAMLAENKAELEALRATAPENSKDDQRVAEIAALSDDVLARDEIISSLRDAMKAAEVEQPVIAYTAEPAANDEELANARQQITKLSDALRKANEDARNANQALSESEAVLAALEAQAIETEVVTPNSSQTEETVQLAALDAQIADLNQVVEKQASALAMLRLGFGDGPVEPMEMAEVCIARASGILESTQITFGTGTSSISADSIATLESLRDLAIGCNHDDVVIEIGGHTDSLGAESSNQALSEARAQSVKEFLAQRGIPAENMIAVGFGEADPIASNDTPVGRAANRRITFMWQMREAEPVEAAAPVETAEPAEPVSDTVDG